MSNNDEVVFDDEVQQSDEVVFDDEVSPVINKIEVKDDAPVGGPDGFVPFTASVPNLGEQFKEFVNPSDPWYKAYQDQKLNIDVNDPETKARIEGYKKDTDLFQQFIAAPKKAGIAALNTFDAATQPLRGAVAGLGARLDAAQQPGLTPYQMVNEFLDPEIIRKSREEYERMGMFNGVPVVNELMRLRFELAPPVEMWDVIHQTDRDMLENAFKGAPIFEDFENGPKFAAQLATSLVSDPLTFAGVGQAKAGNKALSKGGLQEAVAAGEKSLISMKVPFAKVPFYEYSNVKVASAIDDITSSMQASLGVGLNARNLSQHTGFIHADDANLGRSMQLADDITFANLSKEQLKMAGAYDERVSRVAQMMAEHGDDNGVLLAEKMGIKLSPEDIAKAQEVNYEKARITKAGNDLLAAAGGPDLNKASFFPPHERVRAQIIKSINERTKLDVPRIFVTDKAGKEIDLTFSSRYDYGRALKAEEKEARRIDANIRDFNQATKKAGLGEVSSNKQRNRLSTEAMNAILAREGIEGAYRTDTANLVIDKFLEKAEAARDIKYVADMSKRYGVLSGMEQTAIDAAKFRVDKAIMNGEIPDYDDLIVSKLKTSDYVKPNTKAFDKVKYDPNAPWAMKMEEMVFPKTLALKVDQVMMPAHLSKGKIAGTVEWWQRQWSNNVLTNGVRIGKQAVDNLTRLTAINAIPEGVREMAYAMGLRSKDWIDDIASKLPSISSDTAWSMKDFQGPLKVNAKMILDPEVNNSYNAYLKTLHDSAKKNPKAFFDIQGMAEKTLNGVKKVLEFPNQNRVSKFVRNFGNSADVMARKAAFRKYMEQGYSTKDSVKMVNEYLMDFDSTTSFTKNWRYVSPFISFHLKNLESLPKLLAAQPVLVKTFKPEDGYLARAWNDANGWSPEDYKLLQKILPHYRSQFLGPVLKGQKDIINNGKWLPNAMKSWFEAGLSESQKSKMGGMVLSFDVPSFVGAATDFGDLSSSLTSPLSTALQYAGGLNPYTGERHTEDYRVNRNNALAALNPYQFPKVYNKVILPLINKVAPKAAEALRQGPYSSSLEKIFKLEFGKSITDRVKLDENSIRELTNAKFLGLARADVHDMTFFYQQMALLKTMGHMFEGKDAGTLYEKIKLGDREDILRMIGDAGRVADSIKFNTKTYMDFKAKFNVLQREMTPDEKESMNLEIVHDEEAEAQVPVEPEEGEGEEFDFVEDQPTSSIEPQQDRQPAMGSSSPNSPMDARLSNMMQRHAGDLRNPEVVQEEPKTIKGIMDGFIQRNGGKTYNDVKPSFQDEKGKPIAPEPFGRREDGLSDKQVLELRLKTGMAIHKYLMDHNVPLDPQAILNHWSKKDKIDMNNVILRVKDLGGKTSGEVSGLAVSNAKDALVMPVAEGGKYVINLTPKAFNKKGDLTFEGLNSLRHEYGHISDMFHGRAKASDSPKNEDPYHHSQYQDRYELYLPKQIEIKSRIERGEVVPQEEVDKWFKGGLTPQNLIIQNEQEQNRSPAGQRAFDETSAGGGAGLPSGSGIGALLTGGAASMMAGREGGAQNAEAIGSKATDKQRQYRIMSDDQLFEQDDSFEKDNELRYRGLLSDPVAEKKKGYKVLLKRPSEEDLENYRFAVKEDDEYSERSTKWQRIAPNSNTRNLPGYVELLLESDDPNYRGDPHWEEKGVRAWVRGFSPNPETFLILENQAHKGDPEKFKVQRDAIREGVEYAKNHGYSKIGLVTPEGAAKVEGHPDVLPAFESLYGEIGPNVLKKAAGKSTLKRLGPEFDLRDYYNAYDEFADYKRAKLKETKAKDPRMQWLDKLMFDKDQKKTRKDISSSSKEQLLKERIDYNSYDIRSNLDKIVDALTKSSKQIKEKVIGKPSAQSISAPKGSGDGGNVKDSRRPIVMPDVYRKKEDRK